MFTTRVIAYLGLVLYAPSIAIKSLTGVHESISVLVVGVLTTGYTMKGGMNAVVWTDFIQSVVLIVLTAYIVWKCLADVSSAEFQSAVRVDAKFFEFDPTKEITFWSAVFGTFFLFYVFFVFRIHTNEQTNTSGIGINSIAQGGTDQVAIQRYLTTSNTKQSLRACFLAWFLNGIYCGFLGITGVALYAFFHSNGRSDPVEDKDISSSDMIVPFFTSHELQSGSAGLLVAAIVGCSLSVVGAGLNAASTCLVIDIMPILKKKEKADQNLVRNTRLATLTFGILSMGMAILYMIVGSTLIELNQVVFSMVSAPLLTLFLLGILSVRANAFGAWCALLGNCFAMLFIVTGLVVDNPSEFPKISPFWYTGFITLIGTLFGRVASIFRAPPQNEQIHGLTFWTRSVDSITDEALSSSLSSSLDEPLISSTSTGSKSTMVDIS